MRRTSVAPGSALDWVIAEARRARLHARVQAHERAWEARAARLIGAPLWLTTADVARILQISRQGVNWLARRGQMRAERTPSGQRLFRLADVLTAEDARARARSRSRVARLQALRLQMRKAAIEPVQLSLFTGRQLRLVTRRRMRGG